MRVLMQLSMPVEGGNHAARTGALGAPLGKLIEALKPEAAYFYANAEGERCGCIVFDLKDTSEIPGIAEPFFHGYNARINMYPAMNAEDLAKAAPAIEKAVKEFGRAASA